MNALTTTDTISPATLEHVLGTGDISKLSTQQRVEFYKAACRSLNLNPLTRPIRFLTFQGQTQAYFTRDGTDQLRKNNQLSLNVVDKRIEEDIYIVTVRAKSPEGREDEDIGAVPIGKLIGEARANAYMKCLTKAKRRVTLSFCGLGWSSEDELATMPGVQTFDHDAEVEPAKPEPEPQPQPRKMSWTQHADALELAERDAGGDPLQIAKIITRSEITELRYLAEQGAITPAKTRILDCIARMERKYLADPPQPEEPEDDAPAIKGEEYVGAG